MKTLVIASQKGGSGKSTLAIHLAVQAQSMGFETLLADLDPHSQTSAEWAACRRAQTPLVVKTQTENMLILQQQAQSEGFNLLILDCPPYVDEVIASATRIADYTLIPAQPRFADIRTLPRGITRVKLPFAVVLNACTAGSLGQESSKTREARQVLEENQIPVCPISIIRREAYCDALNGGEAVTEFDPKGKAAHEIQKLWYWLEQEWKHE